VCLVNIKNVKIAESYKKIMEDNRKREVLGGRKYAIILS